MSSHTRSHFAEEHREAAKYFLKLKKPNPRYTHKRETVAAILISVAYFECWINEIFEGLPYVLDSSPFKKGWKWEEIRRKTLLKTRNGHNDWTALSEEKAISVANRWIDEVFRKKSAIQKLEELYLIVLGSKIKNRDALQKAKLLIEIRNELIHHESTPIYHRYSSKKRKTLMTGDSRLEITMNKLKERYSTKLGYDSSTALALDHFLDGLVAKDLFLGIEELRQSFLEDMKVVPAPKGTGASFNLAELPKGVRPRREWRINMVQIKFKKIKKTTNQRLRDLELHLKFLTDDYNSMNKNIHYYRRIASELRVLLIEKKHNTPLLLSLLNEFGLDGMVPISISHRDLHKDLKPIEEWLNWGIGVSNGKGTNLKNLILAVAETHGCAHEDVEMAGEIAWTIAHGKENPLFDGSGEQFFLNQFRGAAVRTIALCVHFLEYLEKQRKYKPVVYNDFSTFMEIKEFVYIAKDAPIIEKVNTTTESNK